jgi:hypothetical protein
VCVGMAGESSLLSACFCCAYASGVSTMIL